MDKENVLIGHIMMDLDIYSITRNLSNEEKASYYDAIMKKYRNEKYENHLINDKVKMCFDFSCMDIDKCKAIGDKRQKERSANASKAGIASAEARRAKKEAREQAEQQGTEDASPSDEIPLVDVEEVEKYPFEEFWKLYGMQIGEIECRMKWSRMRESTKAKVMEHLPKYVASTPNKQYRAEPFNYLSRGYYNNEIIDRTQTNTNNYGSNNGKSYKEAEFERNARTAIENLQAAERGELAYLSPFNPPSGQH